MSESEWQNAYLQAGGVGVGCGPVLQLTCTIKKDAVSQAQPGYTE